MANILNNVLTNNQPINKPAPQVPTPAFVIDTKNKVKPLEDKATLLPSRIFGSPIQYVKDLKQDVLNIGKAVKGQANDHELGRINDLAMKGGALALATYLCVKNPLKLSKAMEFAGVGTFFASMALWPKLAIQAPLKARTGVDIHQKYIDSQGRKKMLHQDPQYDLTDLYSREDLDKMGKKLKVSENLPDRDRFIKQRAKKTAVQGNTLWMMTAGIATPVMGALGANMLEQPIANLIEKVELKKTAKALEEGLQVTSQADLTKLNEFIQANKDKPLTSDMAKEIAAFFGKDINSSEVATVIEEKLKTLGAESARIQESAIESLWKSTKGIKDIPMPTIPAELLAQEGGSEGLLTFLAQAASKNPAKQEKYFNYFKKNLQPKAPSVGAMEKDITSIGQGVLGSFLQRGKALKAFMQSRIGQNSGSYLSTQWGKVSKSFLKSLHLSSKELKAIKNGDMSIIYEKLAALASDDAAYTSTIGKLSGLVDGFEQTTGEAFINRIKTSAETAAEGLGEGMKEAYVQGTIKETGERVLGEKSSFYRLLQTLDLFKRAKDGELAKQLEQALGRKPDKDLVKICKKILIEGISIDHIEKFTNAGYGLTVDEYKAVMGVLYQGASSSATTSALQGTTKTGLRQYIKDMKDKVINWKNTITPELSRRVLEENVPQATPTERTLTVGQPIKDFIQDGANKLYNSKKWLKIFGGTMIALTAVTLIATLLIGKKGKTEKQAEQESKKVNG